MTRLGMLMTVTLAFAAGDAAQAQEKPKVAPEIAKLLQGGPKEFIKTFDKNKNGFLEKDELPPKLVEYFDKADLDKDGKLDAREVGALMVNLRKALGLAEPAAGIEVERLVDQFLGQMDTNKDGK